MAINYNEERISTALEDFVRATGINIQFVKADFTSFCRAVSPNNYCAKIQATKKGKNACTCSDRAILERCRETGKTELHLCHAGLMDAAVPIEYDGAKIGFLVLGQMKTEKAFEEIKGYLEGLGLGADSMAESYEKLPIFDEDKIKSIARVAEMLARYLLLENMLKTTGYGNIDAAVEYINQNLSEPLSVELIAEKGSVSKNTLYRGFKAAFDMTVSEYVTKKRVERAEKLLLNTELSVEEISQQTGFSSSAYFAANFKRLNGISPLKFRKERRNGI